MSPRRGSLSGVEDNWSIAGLREPRYSQSLERGLAILASFSPSCPTRGIVDVADELGMRRGTTHRYMSTLVALGSLKQNASRKYGLGLGVTALGMSAMSSTDLREHARPYLEALCRQSSYTVSLSVLDGPEILYIDHLQSTHRRLSNPGLGLARGARLPAYCTAMGKLLLANLPEQEQLNLLTEMKLTKVSPNTITSKSTLRTELDHLREDGLAVEDQELAPEMCAIAAPVRSEPDEVVAAASISAHSSMIALEEMVEHLSPHLVAVANHISARLGYRRPDERV